MEIFKKLKRFFQSNVTSNNEKTIKIIPENAEESLNEINKIINHKFELFNSELSIYIKNLEEDLVALSDIDITKKKAPEKHRNITDIGRKDYLNLAYKFVSIIKSRKNFSDVISEIDKFAEKSLKGYSKATILIGKEMEEISKDIINIRELAKKYLDNNLELINRKNSLEQIVEVKDEKNKLILRREELVREFNEIEDNIKKDKVRKSVALDFILRIENSPEHLEIQKLLNEKKSLERIRKNNEIKLKELIERKLVEKYIHIENNKSKINTASLFLDSMIYLLESNKEADIIKIIDCIEKKVNDNEIVLKNSERAVMKMKELTKLLPDLKYKHNQNKKDISEKIYQINSIKIQDTDKYKIEISRIEFGLTEKEKRLKNLRNKIIEIKEKIKAVDFKLDYSENRKV